MPNIKSSERSVKSDAKRHARNVSVKSAVKTVTRKTLKATEPGDAQALLAKASSLIDKAAKRGILHRNTAARKKSRLAKRVNKLAAE